MLFRSLLFSALAISSQATSSHPEYVVHEKRVASPAASLQNRVRVARDVIVPVKIGLTQRNLDKGYDFLMDVSHPDSPNYGKHWTADEVHDMFGPADETVDTVKSWLITSGLSANRIFYSRQGWLSVDMPAYQAEELLRTEYYEHPSEDGSVRVGCDEYSLPRHITAHVDYIKPGISLSPPMKKRTMQPVNPQPTGGPLVEPYVPDAAPVPEISGNVPQNLQGCGQYITPPCLFALYNITRSGNAASSNALGVYETEYAYTQNDLNSFYSAYADYIPAGTGPTVHSINGGVAPAAGSSTISAEANADLQIAYSLIYPQTMVNYQDSGRTVSEADYSWVTAMLDAVDGSFCSPQESSAGYDCGTFPLTTVLSTSYAVGELASVTVTGQTRSCNEFMKLSLQGHTFLYSSGDNGVAFGPNGDDNGCFNPNGNNPSNGTVFSPSFPSNCPYVLSVSATKIEPGSTVYDPEGAMSQSSTFSSAGGFSNYFTIPSYQSGALNTYFTYYDPPYPYYTSNGNDVLGGQSNVGENGGLYNRGGRGFPDVSANGASVLFYSNGGLNYAYGTSLATPVWASVITLINEERSSQGKSPVGFVHPVLYSNPGAFHDITIGNNPGCGTNGFSAVPGWDPITGLGTPNFPALLEVFSSLQ